MDIFELQSAFNSYLADKGVHPEEDLAQEVEFTSRVNAFLEQAGTPLEWFILDTGLEGFSKEKRWNKLLLKEEGTPEDIEKRKVHLQTCSWVSDIDIFKNNIQEFDSTLQDIALKLAQLIGDIAFEYNPVVLLSMPSLTIELNKPFSRSLILYGHVEALKREFF
jgi:hypothetical protein